MLPQLSETNRLSPNLKSHENGSLQVIMGESLSEEDLNALKQLTAAHVALLTPVDWYSLRDQNDQNWTVMNPKKKQEEILYSTITFFHPANTWVEQLLALAKAKEWAVYAFGPEHVFCLVLNTGVAFNVEQEGLLTHLRG